MNTVNSYGMYDSPKRDAEREPLSFTQDELQRQLEAGAFVLDKDKAIESGLVSPYDDETDSIVLREEKKQ